MRGGKLMAEQCPQSLMQSMRCSSLEEVLLKLCVLQSSTKRQTSSVHSALEIPPLNTVVEEDIKTSENTAFIRRKVPPIERIKVLVWKTAISLLRNYWVLINFLGSAVLAALLFCLVFGRIPDLKLSVFNQETNCSIGLTAWNSRGYGNSTDCEMPGFLSCKMIESLREGNILPVSSESESASKNDIRKGRVWGVITFPENFTSALLIRARYSSPYDVEDDVINMGSIQVTLDQSDHIKSHLIKIQILESLKGVLRDINDVCHNFRHMKDIPMQMKTPIYGGSKINYVDTVAPGFISGVSFLLASTVALSTLLPEKLAGTLERGLVVGVQMGEVIMSFFLVCTAPLCLAMALLVMIHYVFFGFVMNGSFWTISVVLVPLGVCGMLLGFILALTCRTVTDASLLGTEIFFVCLFTSGTGWPVEAISPLIRPLCWISPLTLSTEAIRFIAVRGWPLNNKSVQLGPTSTVLWSLAFFALLLITLRFKR